MATKNLPAVHPAETLTISPEALEIANTYLQCQDLNKTAEDLGLTTETVSSILARNEVKAYIDNVFLNVGFNNRFVMREAMDALIKRKFQELDEAGAGSTKDIAELLEISHRMTMDYMKAQIALEKAKAANIKTQTNIQINEGQGTNYQSLLDKLLNNK